MILSFSLPLRYLLAALLGVVLAMSAWSTMANSRIARNVQFSNITSQAGLSAEFVHSVVQDRHGYLWFGTQDGLNRYDGHDLVVYEHNSKRSDSLSNNFIWSLYLDAQGELWVTTNRGINRYDYAADAFIRNPLNLPEAQRGLRIRTMTQGPGGTFWLGTVDQGLLAVEPHTSLVRHYQADSNNSDSLTNDHVIVMMHDRKARLWVGTDGGGLVRWDQATNTFVSYRHDSDNAGSISDDEIRSIYEDRAGKIWVGTSRGGLNVFDDTSSSFRSFRHDPNDPNSLGAGQVPSILQDNKGTLWVGTESGLSEWRPGIQGFVHYRNDVGNPNSLVNDKINALFQDASGVLWLATNAGVSSWNYFSDTFTYYLVAHGFLASDVVTSLAETSDGVLWVGTYGGGLSRLDLAFGNAQHFRHDAADPASIADDRVMAVYVDKLDRVWVGTRSGGLDLLEADGSFRHFRHDPRNPRSISGDAITSLTTDDKGGLWVGVFGAGLNHLVNIDEGVFERFMHDPNDPHSLSSDRVLTLHRDAVGHLWVGTESGGISRLRAEGPTFDRFAIVAPESQANSEHGTGTAWDIAETSDGAFWIGTMDEGLLRWDAAARDAGQTKFKRFGKAEGLASTIYTTVVGAMGEVWVSSARGLFRLDPAAETVAQFDAQNGLQGGEFTQGARLRSRSGRLLFGSNHGLVGFFPSEIPRNARAPQMHVTASSRHAQLTKVATGEAVPHIQIGYLDPFVAFDFVALDYVSPDKNRYRYRLRGFDGEWVEEDRFRRATYTNLPPGDYLFEILGTNNDGVWSEQAATISITVTSPPWQRWWAYLGYALTILFAVGWYLRIEQLAHRRETLQRNELEKQVEERTSELANRYSELEALNEKLAEASVTDSLTGLRNRRYVDQFIDTEISMVQRRLTEDGKADPDHGQSDSSKLLFFMMIDLDGFKYINDTYGHQAGDKVLIQVKEVLLECCRTSDVVIRWGGDEFMIIGHASSFAGVKILAERIRESLVEHAYDVGRDGEVGRVSGSIGLSPYPFVLGQLRDVRWEQVAAIADKGAYLAKENGRNAWVSVRGTQALTLQDFALVAHDIGTLVEDEKIVLDSSVETPLKLKWDDQDSYAVGT